MCFWLSISGFLKSLNQRKKEHKPWILKTSLKFEGSRLFAEEHSRLLEQTFRLPHPSKNFPPEGSLQFLAFALSNHGPIRFKGIWAACVFVRVNFAKHREKANFEKTWLKTSLFFYKLINKVGVFSSFLGRVIICQWVCGVVLAREAICRDILSDIEDRFVILKCVCFQPLVNIVLERTSAKRRVAKNPQNAHKCAQKPTQKFHKHLI